MTIGCNIVEQRWSVENKKLAMQLGSAINPGVLEQLNEVLTIRMLTWGQCTVGEIRVFCLMGVLGVFI